MCPTLAPAMPLASLLCTPWSLGTALPDNTRTSGDRQIPGEVGAREWALLERSQSAMVPGAQTHKITLGVERGERWLRCLRCLKYNPPGDGSGAKRRPSTVGTCDPESGFASCLAHKASLATGLALS